MIAILFLLLATFATFAMTLEHRSSILLDLPICGCSCGGMGDPAHQPVVVQVTDAGLFWNKELITQRELPVVLAKYVALCKSPHIVLAGDDHAKYGTTVATLDEIRKAGITQVTIETVYRQTGR